MVTATTTPVGQYYQLEHDRITLNNFSRQTTEWDLLTYLAEQEGFDVWVSGNSLYFQPAPTATAAPFPITYDPTSGALNVSHLRMERSLTLAHDIQVMVKSWNSKHKTAYTRVVKSTGAKTSGAPVQNYVLTVANKTPDECLKLGNQKLAELTKHERVLSVDMPGELTLSTRSMAGLTGTGTAFDQVYYVAEVERSISFDAGFTQRAAAEEQQPADANHGAVMDRLLNALKLHAGGMDLHGAEPRLGIVTSYDPTNAAARVMIQPENTLSGWLPVAAVRGRRGGDRGSTVDRRSSRA